MLDVHKAKQILMINVVTNIKKEMPRKVFGKLRESGLVFTL